MKKLPYRVGLGYDIHQLVEGRDLILGGVKIDFEKGLLGHSDADVLTHAIMDAICGALNIGDIGQNFPDTDPAYKDIESLRMLKNLGQRLDQAGYEIGNIDAVICAQRPKLAPFISEMKKNIAQSLNCSMDQVSIKATTTEKLGFVGKEEGLASFASLLILAKED